MSIIPAAIQAVLHGPGVPFVPHCWWVRSSRSAAPSQSAVIQRHNGWSGWSLSGLHISLHGGISLIDKDVQWCTYMYIHGVERRSKTNSVTSMVEQVCVCLHSACCLQMVTDCNKQHMLAPSRGVNWSVFCFWIIRHLYNNSFPCPNTSSWPYKDSVGSVVGSCQIWRSAPERCTNGAAPHFLMLWLLWDFKGNLSEERAFLGDLS